MTIDLTASEVLTLRLAIWDAVSFNKDHGFHHSADRVLKLIDRIPRVTAEQAMAEETPEETAS